MSLRWLMSSRLLFSYSRNTSLSNDIFLLRKKRTSNLELCSKSKGKAVLPLFYMAEKVHSMLLPVRRVSRWAVSGPRTAPRLIGSRGAWLCTATLTSPCSATNQNASEPFQRTREKIITLYIKKKKKMLPAYATCLFVAKIAVFFFLYTKSLRLEIKRAAQFPS